MTVSMLPSRVRRSASRDIVSSGVRRDDDHDGFEPGSLPTGGLIAGSRVQCAWKWSLRADRAVSARMKCRPEDWYLLRGELLRETDAAADHAPPITSGDAPEISVEFHTEKRPAPVERIDLQSMDQTSDTHLGWIKSPRHATHFNLTLSGGTKSAASWVHLTLHKCSERFIVGHAHANVPSWSQYRARFESSRIVLPRSLSAIEPVLADRELQVLEHPGSLDAFAERIRGAACVLDPDWAAALRLNWKALQYLARESCVIVDLETAATLIGRHLRTPLRLTNRAFHYDVPCARIEYSDLPTRGFALQDVIPYAVDRGDGKHSARVLNGGPAWRRFADAHGAATLLSCECPTSISSELVLAAAMPTAGGELIISDIPWLAAGVRGRALTPDLFVHLLRMHLECAIEPGAQFWCPTENVDSLVRDIAELARRYAPLRAERWASDAGPAFQLGLSLAPPGDKPAARQVTIHTGRIDRAPRTPSIPGEPMMILMRTLARDLHSPTSSLPSCHRELLRRLGDVAITWRFEAEVGGKYVHLYTQHHSSDDANPCVIDLRRSEFRQGSARTAWPDLNASGLLGNWSLAIQRQLLKALVETVGAL